MRNKGLLVSKLQLGNAVREAPASHALHIDNEPSRNSLGFVYQ